MAKSNQTPPPSYPVGVGRILNRHKRGRPRRKWWRRLAAVLFAAAVLASLAFIVLFIAQTLGLI